MQSSSNEPSRWSKQVIRLSFLAVLPMLAAPPVQAADDLLDAEHAMAGHDHAAMSGHPHAGMMAPDGREFVFFPPEMRTHQLADMRDHMATLDGILRELASADYERAAKLAVDHLGLDSPSAAGCKPKQAGAPSPAMGSMEDMMNLYMPEQMRAIGLAMHTSASEFANVSRDAAKSGDAKAVFGALSQVTQYCVACHAAYRLQ